MTSKLKVVGLTGGIASGKSTVAGFFREAEVPVIDADSLGHMVLDKTGEAFEPVVSLFGDDILCVDGTIDRQKLGSKVFDNAEKRAHLEAITHPAIARLSKQGMKFIEQRGKPMAVYEAALLVETGVHKSLEALIVVSCSLETQLRRVMGRDQLSKEAAAARIASQLPLEEKLAAADYIIENEGTIAETRTSSLNVLAELRKNILGIE